MVKHKLDAVQRKDIPYALEALVFRTMHSGKRRCRSLPRRLISRWPRKLRDHADSSKDPHGAANALWALAAHQYAAGTRIHQGCVLNPDWRVRRWRIS